MSIEQTTDLALFLRWFPELATFFKHFDVEEISFKVKALADVQFDGSREFRYTSESGNAGCDRCGTNDRETGSKLCEPCQEDNDGNHD